MVFMVHYFLNGGIDAVFLKLPEGINIWKALINYGNYITIWSVILFDSLCTQLSSYVLYLINMFTAL